LTYTAIVSTRITGNDILKTCILSVPSAVLTPRLSQAHSYLPVLFSGRRSATKSNPDSTIDKDSVKDWVFEQPVKIPSYLIAIAAGELVYREMGHVSQSPFFLLYM
jgi:hypothetical protein